MLLFKVQVWYKGCSRILYVGNRVKIFVSTAPLRKAWNSAKLEVSCGPQWKLSAQLVFVNV